MKAIEKTHPRTVDDVYRLAVRHVRFAFVDVIKKQRREDAPRAKALIQRSKRCAELRPG